MKSYKAQGTGAPHVFTHPDLKPPANAAPTGMDDAKAALAGAATGTDDPKTAGVAAATGADDTKAVEAGAATGKDDTKVAGADAATGAENNWLPTAGAATATGRAACTTGSTNPSWSRSSENPSRAMDARPLGVWTRSPYAGVRGPVCGPWFTRGSCGKETTPANRQHRTINEHIIG